jgi:hypothetical protein
MDIAVSRRLAVFVLPLAVTLAGCDVSLGHLSARATEEWTHTYPLTAGGEVRIINTNGRSTSKESTGRRSRSGPSGLPRAPPIPRLASCCRGSSSGERHARPRHARNRAHERHHDRRRLRGPLPRPRAEECARQRHEHERAGRGRRHRGKVVAHTTNGGVKGTALTGGVDARSTNGGVSIEMASVGPDRISLETTNGGVTLMLPENAKATVSASCTNGGISVGSLDNFEVSEKSRRHLEGRLNGGGTEIELQTTNGGIRLRSRDTVNTAHRHGRQG